MKSDPKKVLLIYDEKDICDLYQDVLLENKIQSLVVHSVDDAMKACLEEDFCFIISDLAMPGLSGLDFLVFVNDRNIPSPVIMVSAFGEYENLVSAMRLGAIDFLVKPDVIKELKKKVPVYYEFGRIEWQIANLIKDDPNLTHSRLLLERKTHLNLIRQIL